MCPLLITSQQAELWQTREDGSAGLESHAAVGGLPGRGAVHTRPERGCRAWQTRSFTPEEPERQRQHTTPWGMDCRSDDKN